MLIKGNHKLIYYKTIIKYVVDIQEGTALKQLRQIPRLQLGGLEPELDEQQLPDSIPLIKQHQIL